MMYLLILELLQKIMKKIINLTITILAMCSSTLAFSETLPFVGMRKFNFEGGNGTGQSVTISKNGQMTFRFYGSYAAGNRTSVTYKGKYKNPIRIDEDAIYKIEKIKGKWTISEFDKHGNIKTGCPFSIYSEDLSLDEKADNLFELPCTVSLDKS